MMKRPPNRVSPPMPRIKKDDISPLMNLISVFFVIGFVIFILT